MKVQRTFCSFVEPKDPWLSEPAQRATVQRTKNEGQRPSWIIFALSAWGDFGGEPRGSTPKSVFTMLAPLFRFPNIRLELAIFATSHSVVVAFLVIFYFTGMAAFTSSISISDAQIADAPQLEPRL